MGAIQHSDNSVLNTGTVIAAGGKKLATDAAMEQTAAKNALANAQEAADNATVRQQVAYADWFEADDKATKADDKLRREELLTGETEKQKGRRLWEESQNSDIKLAAFDATHGDKLTRGQKGQRTKLVNRAEKARTALQDLEDEQAARNLIYLRANEKKKILSTAKTARENATNKYNELKADYEKKYGSTK